MHWLMLITMTVVTQAAYLVELQVLPAVFRLLPELMTAILTVMVFFVGLRTGFRNVAAKYWMLFAALIVVLACGAVANSVAPGPIVNGTRVYLRAAPLFLVPAVFALSVPQLRQQLGLILVIAVIQVPLAIYQRFALVAEGRSTGDFVFGTLTLSGIMTVFLVSVICVAAGFAARGRIRMLAFAALALTLLIAIGVNETKATVVLLPIGLLTAVYFGSPADRRGRLMLSAAAILGVMGAVFVPLYDYYARINDPNAYQLADYIFKDKVLQEYVDTDAGVGTRKEAGRVDALVVPFQEITSDPIHAVFGFGLGNASNSSLGAAFTGAYDSVYDRYVMTTSAATYMLEIGLLGCLLLVMFSWFVLRDALELARRDQGILGAFAAGWIAVIIVNFLSLFYLTLHAFESLAYLYVYFCGLVAAARAALPDSTMRR